MDKMIYLDSKELKKALSRMEEFDEGRFFKYLESFVDARRFNNIRKWMDRKGITATKKYNENRKGSD